MCAAVAVCSRPQCKLPRRNEQEEGEGRDLTGGGRQRRRTAGGRRLGFRRGGEPARDGVDAGAAASYSTPVDAGVGGAPPPPLRWTRAALLLLLSIRWTRAAAAGGGFSRSVDVLDVEND